MNSVAQCLLNLSFLCVLYNVNMQGSHTVMLFESCNMVGSGADKKNSLAASSIETIGDHLNVHDLHLAQE